jgi:hypothetical protein
MKMHKNASWVLWYECVGFALIIGFCWTVELTGLASLAFGGEPHTISWRVVTIETLLILLVWGVVFLFTRRLVAHLFYLEGFLRICSWCRRIGYQDNWIPLEEYFEKGFHVGTTHGVCPACFEKEKEETTRFFRQESGKQIQPSGAGLGQARTKSAC